MDATKPKGFWASTLDRISSFLPTSIKEPDELPTYTAGLFGCCTILVGIGAVIALAAPLFRNTAGQGIQTLVITLLTALMALSVGAILGLLFGIPRYNKIADAEGAIAPNNNLEQISDWLTKMIVGITLVQFDEIVGKTKLLATQVTTEMTGCKGTCTDYALGLAVIGFFAAAGFLMMYLWARVYLLLDVDTVQEKLYRAAAALKRFLKNPERIQGKKRQRGNLRRQVEEAGPAMNFAPGTISPGPDSQDPWKGAFGGKSRDDSTGRELAATIHAVGNDYCSVRLTVKSTDPAQYPLTGEVTFFLHDTFPQPIQSVAVKDHAAELEVVAWGAFTVGALADNGNTKLELDLSTVASAPADWRAR